MATIYALLVGINHYAKKPLKGCANDVKAVTAYLEKMYGNNVQHTLHLKTITDADQPTKQNIIDAFHFFDAASGTDTCLFYYSGHGASTEAPSEFPSSNGLIQSFVCADSRNDGGLDLVDKEMGVLIWKTMRKKPDVHFLVITDCCHSGTITKAVDASDVTDRIMLGDQKYLPAKPEDYFGFDKTIEEEKAYIQQTQNSTTPFYVVRQGNHIHLAASKDKQTSKELLLGQEQRGVFTWSLLKVLYTCAGQISYKELVNRAAALIKNLVYDQQPLINCNGNLPLQTQYTIFLTPGVVHAEPRFLISFHQKFGWGINGGFVHNISKGDTVIIEDGKETLVIGTPIPNFSQIRKIDMLVNQTDQYYARVERQPEKHTCISFAGVVPETIKNWLKQAVQLAPNIPLILAEDTLAQYYIRYDDESKLYISTAGSEAKLFLPLLVSDVVTAGVFLEQLVLVRQWVYVQELYNPDTEIKKEHYSLKLYRAADPDNISNKQMELIEDILPVNEFNYQVKENKWIRPCFQLSITNASTISLWVTNAYLGFDYSITAGAFTEMEIAPGKTAWLEFVNKGVPDTNIRLLIDTNYQKKGYNQITEYLKIFIGAEKVDISKLDQHAVVLPDVVQLNTKSIGVESKELPTPKSVVSFPKAWQCETIGFHIVRPSS
jgi:hypothetical protein